MKNKSIGFDEMFDVRAVRVLVENVADCYAALGLVHTHWRPIRSEFDDYVATPKDNDYQSLHTAVIGPENKTLEIQIRTFSMHEHAEYGVAAHWGYKEGGSKSQQYHQRIAWLRQLLELKDGDVDPGELVESFKAEVFDDRVYALTPRGKVIDLIKGATPLDFAYAIHTEVGHRFRGAKVDGKIVPIGYTLQNGQQVEILTSKHGHPSRDWLNPHLGYYRCSRTRTKIRAWFKQQDYEKNLSDGKAMVEREVRRLGITDLDYLSLSQRYHFDKEDDFFAALGRGDVNPAKVSHALHELVFHPPVTQPLSTPKRLTKSSMGESFQIMGVGDLMTLIARCCKPVPHDEIAGYITRGRGVSIHRVDCPNYLRLAEKDSDRVIEVAWGEPSGQKTFPVDIQVVAFDRQGLLRDITTILTNNHLNVIAMNTHTDKHSYKATMRFTIEVSDVDQLSLALTKIDHLQNVQEVSRFQS